MAFRPLVDIGTTRFAVTGLRTRGGGRTCGLPLSGAVGLVPHARRSTMRRATSH